MIDLSYMIPDMTKKDTHTRTNPFSGVSVELTMEEALRYDQIKKDEINENYGLMNLVYLQLMTQMTGDCHKLQCLQKNLYQQMMEH